MVQERFHVLIGNEFVNQELTWRIDRLKSIELISQMPRKTNTFFAQNLNKETISVDTGLSKYLLTLSPDQE